MTHPSPGCALLLLGMLLFVNACEGAGAGQRVESNAAPAASSEASAPAAARPPAVTEPAPSTSKRHRDKFGPHFRPM